MKVDVNYKHVILLHSRINYNGNFIVHTSGIDPIKGFGVNLPTIFVKLDSFKAMGDSALYYKMQQLKVCLHVQFCRAISH
jgi:hypothetical protein